MIERTPKLRADEALWRFSLALYGRPGVSEALITLQDRAGCDVNLMLFALWSGVSQGSRLTIGELACADLMARPVRADIVEPLRTLRRKLRGEPDADVQRLRKGIKALELAAEKAIQSRLCRSAQSCGGDADPAARIAAAQANLVLYLGPEFACSPEAAVIENAVEAF